METYVALLRGINVSGQKKIHMAALKVHLEELGLENIRTYVQSGNIIFNSREHPPGLLALNIGKKIREKYNFEVPVLILEPLTLKYILDNNPFTRDPAKAENRLYVTFLYESPPVDMVHALEELKKSSEQFVIDGKIIFLYYPDGYGRAVMNNNAFEHALKVMATTRNWKTVNKLYEISYLYN